MFGRLSLNEGIPIGKIEGGKYNGKTIKVFTSDEKGDCNEYFISDEGKITPLHCKTTDGKSNRINIAGATLSGKSYYAGKIAKDYKKRNPDNKVVLFSAIDNDKHLDDIDGLYRIRCDESILDDPIDPKELHDSLCIFDDINNFGNKFLSEDLNYLRDQLMKGGRHYNTDVISTNQLLLDGVKSKQSLLNSFQVVGFPKTGGRYQLKEFLKRYMSLDKELIDKIINLPSRWVCINRVHPNYVMHEKGVFML